MPRATLLLLALFASCCCAGACFADLAELIDAADAYVADPRPSTAVAATYGHPIGAWCVGDVTSFDGVFSGVRNPSMTTFNEDVSAWNVSSATSLDGMFYGALAFNQPLNSWDVSSVTSLEGVFLNAAAFNQPLDAWDVSGVTTMRQIFSGAVAFNQPLDAWDVSNVLFASSMFQEAASFNQPLNAWDVSSVTLMDSMFRQAEIFDQSLDSWNVSNVGNMQFMFHLATAFNRPLHSWDVSGVTSMRNMFYGASALNQTLNSWDVSSVVDMYQMFSEAGKFDQPLGSWNVSRVTNMQSMFLSAASFAQDLCAWGALLQPSTSVADMFKDTACPLPTSPNPTAVPPGPFCHACFAVACFADHAELVTAVDAYVVDPSPSSTVAMTYGHPIGTWCVGNVTTFEAVFSAVRNANMSVFNEDISGWDMSSATNLSGLFQRAATFNQPLNPWNVSGVTRMDDMFRQAASFDQPLDAWDVSAVTQMERMFSQATAFDQPLTTWDVSSTIVMDSMFLAASSFAQDLCAWGTHLEPRAVVDSMFLSTACPTQSSPILTFNPAGPFCAQCGPSSPLPPVISGNVSVGNATVSSSTNVTRGSVVIVQGTLDIRMGSRLNVGDGNNGAVFQVTGDATVSGGSVNVALSEKPPPGTPVTVELVEGASVVGSFDDVTASVPNFDPACESLSVEQQSTGTSISAVVTLSNSCIGGLHPGALAGIVVGAFLAALLVVLLIVAYHARRKAAFTKEMNAQLRDNHLEDLKRGTH